MNVEVRPSPSMAQMDEQIELVVKCRQAYDEAKDISNTLHQTYEAAMAKLLEMMKLADREEFVSRYGTAKIETKLSYQTPKTLQAKKAFFTWLAAREGQEVADSYMTVNSVSLNSLINKMTDEAARKGEVLIPEGLEEPVAFEKVKVR